MAVGLPETAANLTSAPTGGTTTGTETSSRPEELITADESLRGVLPSDFAFGAATAAFQIEGGWDADGKGPSNWDVKFHTTPDMPNGEVTCDTYNRWREDVALLKKYGADSYRFSISWPRVKPLGGADDPVNEAGIAFYSDLVDALLGAGITPFVTLFHWDIPYELEKRYGGFDSTNDIVRDLVAYARLLFERLGDRVKNWITLNEPLIYALQNAAFFKPDIWTDDMWAANSRSLVLCHGYTADLYRREFKERQGGQIGLSCNMDWMVPIDDSEAARKAASDGIDHWLGMYADPIYLGKFPDSSIQKFGADKLYLTPEEVKIVKGSADFFGLNHYSTSWTTGKPMDPAKANVWQKAFGLIDTATEKDGKPIGQRGHKGHPTGVPWGFRQLLQYVHKRYAGPAGHKIYITENGFAPQDEGDKPLEDIVNDTERQAYFASYLRELAEAVRDDGIQIGAYAAWSLLDNLEWNAGYGPRFGITHIDFTNPKRTRTPKDSAFMLGRVMAHLRAQPE